MKIIKKLAIGLLLLIVTLGIVFITLGLFLPDEIIVTKETQINAPPETVWQVMDEQEKYQEWMPNVEKVEVINENKWKEHLKDSEVPIIFETVNLQKPERYELKYQMENLMDGGWVGNLEKTEYGTLLKTEDKITHKSWIGKIMMPLFFNLETFAENFNQQLKKRAENS
jgi:carbon monoxide dehydrogenase subunit G